MASMPISIDDIYPYGFTESRESAIDRVEESECVRKRIVYNTYSPCDFVLFGRKSDLSCSLLQAHP